MTVNNDRELRVAYEILDILADRDGDRAKQRRDSVKRAIRAYQNRPTNQTRVVRSDYSSLVEVFPLPENLETNEDAEAYFLENHYREAILSMYDCTGQIFTSWYKIFKRRGQFWAYHATAMDV